MKFLTNQTFELGLAAIDEAIRRTARRRWKAPLRTKRNPEWVSRGARSEKDGANMFRIILEGRFRVRIADDAYECSGEFLAKVVRFKKRKYAHRVTGSFIYDGETIEIDEEI